MIKTLKGKVVAGTVAVTLVAGAGVAFGASDAGTNLKSWYNNQFGKTTGSIALETGAYSLGKTGELLKEYNGVRQGAVNEINDSKNTNTGNSKTNIENAAREHIAEVVFTQEEINGYMADQFDAISKAAQEAMNNTGRELVGFATTDLTNQTGQAGQKALEYVNTELGKSTADAKAALEKAINDAKGDLTTKLATEKSSTTNEIKEMIDTKIRELRNAINEKKTELVAAQTVLISNKAAELEAAALADLDKLVADINKK